MSLTPDRNAAQQKDYQHSPFMPISTGLLTGLGWGLLIALAEGLPLLLDGTPGPHLGSRLLALAYLALVWGALLGLLGAVLGLVAGLVLRLLRRSMSRCALGGVLIGLFASASAAAVWLQRFGLDGLWLAVAVLVAAGSGICLGWLSWRAARSPAISWRRFRSAVLALFAVAAVAVVAVAGYRFWLRDLPLLNPAFTDQVATPESPNLLLITAGGIRADHLGAYGYDPAISPNIDALAARGIVFSQAIAQSSWTEPSVASLMTSLHPGELGITCTAGLRCEPHLDEQRITLAETLHEAGYHTRAYVNSPWLVAHLGFDQGFDYFEGTRPVEPFDQGPMNSRLLGWLLGCQKNSSLCQRFVQGHELLFDAPMPPGWGGDYANAQVAAFLKGHGRERFFLWLHYSEALPPYNLEPPFRDLPTDPLASSESLLRSMGYWELGDPFTAREVLLPLDNQGLVALYDAEVHRVDRLVGGLTGLIDAYGLSDRTVVAFAADHGQEFGEHGAYTYGHSLYDELLRVPLIIAGPGITSGNDVQTPVGLIDLMPTLLDAAGLPNPSEAEGRSLAAAFRGTSLDALPVYSEGLYRVALEMKAVRHDGYKLVATMDDGTFQLFDLGTDPREKRDLAASGDAVLDDLRERLLSWVARAEQKADHLPRNTPPTQYEDAEW